MRKFLLFILFLTNWSYSQNDSFQIKGQVVDAATKKPLQNFEVRLLQRYGTEITSVNTDENGFFYFKTAKTSSYFLNFENENYIEKLLYIKEPNAPIDLKVRLRARNLNLYEIDSTIIGTRARKVLRKYSLELSDITQIHDPPGICRGFTFELGNRTIVSMSIERTVFLKRDKKWLNQKIIGIRCYEDEDE